MLNACLPDIIFFQLFRQLLVKRDRVLAKSAQSRSFVCRAPSFPRVATTCVNKLVPQPEAFLH